MQEQIRKILQQEQKAGGKLAHLSFPSRKHPQIEDAFVSLAQALCQRLRQDHHLEITPEHVSGLVVKLARYANKRAWNLAAIEAILPTLADAVAAKMDGLADPKLTLGKMLDLHDQHNQQAAADLRRKLAASTATDIAPPVIAETTDGQYRLVECVTEHHLRQETAELRHCVGGISLNHYKSKLARGDARIFSLRSSSDVPLATIEYNTCTKSIIQIEGKQRKISGKEGFFPALCETLYALLQETIPVLLIQGLPSPMHRPTLITSRGKFISPTVEDPRTFPRDILTGVIMVTNDTPPDVLNHFAAIARLTLDVTKLDLLRLPTQVRCKLISYVDSFTAPNLQKADDIYLAYAENVNMPRLKEAGNIYAGHAEKVSLARLVSAGEIYIGANQNLDLLWPQEAYNISVRSSTTLEVAPRMTTSKPLLPYHRSKSAPPYYIKKLRDGLGPGWRRFGHLMI